MDMRNPNRGIFDAFLQSYLLYRIPYHDWIEEEDSEWSDEGGRADQPDGVDDGHEEHEWGDLWLYSTELFTLWICLPWLIEEEDSKWSDEGGRADQPDGVDDGHEEHEGGILNCCSTGLFTL